MKNYSEFISKGKRPFWKVKEFREYIDTLNEKQLMGYILGLDKFIKEKGVNSYDSAFLKKMGYTQERGAFYSYRGNTDYDVNKTNDALAILKKKYFKDSVTGFSHFLYLYNNKFFNERTNISKFKDHSQEFEFLKDFKDAFSYMIGFNYTNDKAAKYIYNETNISLKQATIFEYLNRGKKKG